MHAPKERVDMNSIFTNKDQHMKSRMKLQSPPSSHPIKPGNTRIIPSCISQNKHQNSCPTHRKPPQPLRRVRQFPQRLMSENNYKKAMDSNKSHWTNERHVHFLNSMEDTFVRTMFESNGRYSPRLDRYLPDTLESTEDLVRERRRRHSTSDIVESSGKKTDKKSKLLSPHISSQDQVVPQFQKSRDDKDKDDKDHLDVPLGRPN